MAPVYGSNVGNVIVYLAIAKAAKVGKTFCYRLKRSFSYRYIFQHLWGDGAKATGASRIAGVVVCSRSTEQMLSMRAESS